MVQISGGEPTIRDDLPDIIRMGKEMGIDYIEIGTNGIRFAEDIEFLRKVKEAGADDLYFSFDGLHGDIYKQTCGRDILAQKLKCIENCEKVGMGITLVTVVSPDINLDRVEEVINFANPVQVDVRQPSPACPCAHLLAVHGRMSRPEVC